MVRGVLEGQKKNGRINRPLFFGKMELAMGLEPATT